MDYIYTVYIFWFVLIFGFFMIFGFKIPKSGTGCPQSSRKVKYTIVLFSLASIALTWLLFKSFPVVIDAPKIVTVVIGVLGAMSIIVKLYDEF